ncbi:MAG TPA: sulfatase-like hydrolase/transferase [Planctomycetaceae bacterium]|nr:sulfatase-like hydrolase/transferase [Planctomycetaceae bacterium]
MNAIVVTFDRLPVGLLSCCGNSWIATPNFDRLAARSAVFEQHFADGNSPNSASQSWWTGRSPRLTARDGDTPSLPSLFSEHGVTFRMLVETATEGPTEAEPFPHEWAEVVRGSDGLDTLPEETPFFRAVSRAQRDLRLLRTSRKEPWLLWIKSRGIPVPWLAPRDFATKFLDLSDDDEGAGEPTDELEANEYGDEAEEDVVEMSGAELDDLLRSMAELPTDREGRDALSAIERGLMRRVCGGYVALLDAALGRLLDQIDHEAQTAPTLLIVTAGRGMTVREPGLLHGEWEQLAEETVHTPLFIRSPGMIGGVRRQELVQSVDLFPTLAEWFGIDASGLSLDGTSLLPTLRGEKGEQRSRVLIAGDGLAGIRTSDYYLVRRQEDDATSRLFAKPDDIWETNDLAAQSPDLADQLSGQLAQLLSGEDAKA